MVYVIIAIIYFAVFIFIASLMSSIAKNKGYEDAKPFWLTLFLGIIGILYVIALPDLKEREQREDILSVLLEIKEGNK